MSGFVLWCVLLERRREKQKQLSANWTHSLNKLVSGVIGCSTRLSRSSIGVKLHKFAESDKQEGRETENSCSKYEIMEI